MNILVTGGCGFIGSHFLRELYKNTNNNVVNLDKLTYASNPNNISDLPYETIVGDKADKELVTEIFEKYNIEVIVDFASESHVCRSIKDPESFIRTDIIGTFNLANTGMQYKIKRYVKISTDEVFGPAIDKYGRNIVFTEEDKLNPTSPYSASKASADLLLLSLYKTYNFPVVIVRPCNNYGTHQYPEKLIPMAITRLLDEERVLLHGDGIESREWIHVEDCVKLIHRVLRSGNAGQLYNIGSGMIYNNYQVVSCLIHLIHNCRGKQLEWWIKRVPNRPSNDMRYAIDSSKILTKYPIHFKNLKQGLRETIEWYKEHPHWWGTIDIESNIHPEAYLR
jgi:dTDP-glucose 4,6-dehydratase